MTFDQPQLGRRGFVAGAIGSAVLAASPVRAASPGASITVLLDEPVGTVSPDLYGYLLENLGSVIYDGVWTGGNARIPQINGLRRQLVDHLKRIKPGLIRWPGGNFADYYNWRDGIGPRADRPRRINPWSDEMPAAAKPGPQRYDPNQFGTHELMDLCRLTGARPFLNVNLRGLTPADATDWVDYCNAPRGSTTLADLRARNGSAAPFGVDYWGIGNEPWSWGGNMTAADYAREYRRFVSGLPRHGRNLKFVAMGGPPTFTDTSWVRTFLAECKRAWRSVPIHGMGVHYYTGFPANHMRPGETIDTWLAAKDDRPRRLISPIDYDAGGWYALLSDSAKIDGLIRANWDAVREFDVDGSIRLMVDEWGGIFSSKTDLSPEATRARIVTLRDALSAALTFDIFHAHADKISAACFTGLINQEGGLFLALGEQFVATPLYHVFAMYADHQGGQALRTAFEAQEIEESSGGVRARLAGLSGSASRIGNSLTLTVVNPHVSNAVEAALQLRGGRITSMHATTLSHQDIRAHNSFANPQMVVPVTAPARTDGRHVFPPASVTKLSITLG